MALAKSATKPELFVLDCSIVFSWYFADESNSYADNVARSLKKRHAVVPGVWSLEVANTLVVGERKKRSTHAQASTFLLRLSHLPITIDDQTSQQAWRTTMDLARKCVLSSYDASYLELAVRKSIPIATLDQSLTAAADSLGVKLYKP